MYLKQFEGNGKEYEIEHLFPELKPYEIKNVLQEIANEGFITFSGREERMLSFIVEKNILTNETNWSESPLNEHILNSEPPKLKAKLTFKGSKYLKEEIQMQESGKYNISVSGEGATNNFVIESQNVNINNKVKFEKEIDEVIERLKCDSLIENELREKAIEEFQKAKLAVLETGKIPNNIFKNLLEYGSNISSIGQLVLGIGQLM